MAAPPTESSELFLLKMLRDELLSCCKALPMGSHLYCQCSTHFKDANIPFIPIRLPVH